MTQFLTYLIPHFHFLWDTKRKQLNSTSIQKHFVLRQKHKQMEELHPGTRIDNPVTLAKIFPSNILVGLVSHMIKQSESKVMLRKFSGSQNLGLVRSSMKNWSCNQD